LVFIEKQVFGVENGGEKGKLPQPYKGRPINGNRTLEKGIIIPAWEIYGVKATRRWGLPKERATSEQNGNISGKRVRKSSQPRRWEKLPEQGVRGAGWEEVEKQPDDRRNSNADQPITQGRRWGQERNMDRSGKNTTKAGGQFVKVIRKGKEVGHRF